jgi:hypothetical protein
MTAFDLRTSYATDYELVDLVEEADFEPENQGLADTDPKYRHDLLGKIRVCQLADVNNPDYIAATLGLALSPTSKVFVCWSPCDAAIANPWDDDRLFKPQVNDVIVTHEINSAWPGRWIINNIVTNPYSHWILAVDKARTNKD